MSSSRVWLFRVLVAIAAGLMIASFIMPWWTTTSIVVSNSVQHSLPRDAIRIYGYGLQHSLVDLRSYIIADETPFYQTVLAWVYLAASAGLLLFSTWLKTRKGSWLLGGIGLIYIAYAAIAVFVVIVGRLADFGISLQGWSNIPGEFEGQAFRAIIYTRLLFGYYLAYAAGLTCIVLALLRDRIVGKGKLSA